MRKYLLLFFQPAIKSPSGFCFPALSRYKPSFPLLIQFLFALLIVSFSVVAVAADLKEIKTLVKAGVPELALAMIDRHQPDVQNNQPAWIRWEKQRFSIYKQLNKYQNLNERIDKLPAKLPLSFYHWAINESIRGHLLQGDGFGARSLAKKLIWGDYGTLKDEYLVEIRRLIIMSYLVEDLPEDAYEAMQVHRREFAKGRSQSSFSENRAWSLLNAQVLLISGHAARANKELLELSGHDVEPLKLLVALRMKGSDPDEIIRQAKQKKRKLKKRQQIPYWAIIANASRLKQDYKSQIWALEKVLAVRKNDTLFGHLYSANADKLWEAYLDYGNRVKQKLKSGANDKVLFEAAKSYRDKEMFDARSLFAYLAINSSKEDAGNEAHREFVSTLYLNRYGYRVVNRLYLESARFPNIETIPASVRHLMTGKALETSNIKLASKLLQGQVKVPKNVNELDWHLRRARVHILAGEFQQGMEVLLGVFENVEKLNNKQVDRLLQVLFDLQALGKHRTVLPLFEIVMKRTQDKKRKREILYWIADSMKSLEEYAEAARYYLKSASVTNPQATDLWAQSARFQAAEALANAGLVVDAKGVLKRLLQVTTDPGRRALLERRIIQLETVGIR